MGNDDVQAGLEAILAVDHLDIHLNNMGPSPVLDGFQRWEGSEKAWYRGSSGYAKGLVECDIGNDAVVVYLDETQVITLDEGIDPSLNDADDLYFAFRIDESFQGTDTANRTRSTR